MPGSGKSFLGKRISEAVGYKLTDLDAAIEEKEGITISEIFSTKGEVYFRQLEHDTLQEVTEKSEHQIISAGGGTPLFHQGMHYMNEHGITVFLETDRELLIERLAAKSHRPLVQGNTAAKVDELLQRRLPIYRMAHFTIAHREVDRLIDEIKVLKVKP